MIGMLKRHEIEILLKTGHSQPEVARLSGVGLRSVRRIAGEPSVVDVDDAAERVKEQGAPVSLTDAWESFLSDLGARSLSHETVRKYKLLNTRMTAFAAEKGLTLLADFDVDTLTGPRCRLIKPSLSRF
jgi:hypothetical protein